jgi:murein L,D-transpeptidase YafK
MLWLSLWMQEVILALTRLLYFAIILASVVSGSLTAIAASDPEPIAEAKGGENVATAFERKGVKFGSPIFLRIYKQSSELELWVERGPRYVLLKTYGICRWSGTLGPKLYKGDRQSPEGLYYITIADLIVTPHWHRAMNINYPNSYDRLYGRSGSGILIHGKCTSTGCFAIRDSNAEEVYEAVRAALRNGQGSIPVLSLPFRFAADGGEGGLALDEFWADLRRGDRLFERDKLPPPAWLCNGRYYFSDRRGDRRRHAVHLAGCQPFAKPVTSEQVAAFRASKQTVSLSEASAQNVKEAVQRNAETCDPKDPHCRLLRVAVKSSVICPQKYGRCRTAQATYTKSIECPLKYPRCRWFVGPEPTVAQSAGGVAAKSKSR